MFSTAVYMRHKEGIECKEELVLRSEDWKSGKLDSNIVRAAATLQRWKNFKMVEICEEHFAIFNDRQPHWFSNEDKVLL